MTREEAKKILQQIRKQKCVSECDYDCKLYESETFCLEEKALDTAIKVLEQESCEDTLKKIRAEILDEAEYAYANFDEYKYDILHAEPDELPDDDFRYGMERAIEIINKYRKGGAE